MLPKIIHYCWFGGSPLPDSVLRYIGSWKNFCPDYQILQWDENNYPIEQKCAFVRNAYRNKKWAFVSDYARLDIVYQNGGIYFDTDVELIKPLDGVLASGYGFWGFEDEFYVASGLGFGAYKEDPILKEMLEYYDAIEVDENDEEFLGDKNIADYTCPKINTKILKKHGLKQEEELQRVGDYIIYPTEYFCPASIDTGKTKVTEKTVSIHHYDASWLPWQRLAWMRSKVWIKGKLPTSFVKNLQWFLRRYVWKEAWNKRRLE